MALVASTVADGGVLMSAARHGDSGRAGSRPAGQTIGQVLSRDDAIVKQAMMQAVEGRYGRLFTTGAAVPGIPTAGKSGTAQLGGTGEPHTWFIGFAPVNDPQIAIAVLVEHGGRGGSRASPLAGQLMKLFFDTEGSRRPDDPGCPIASRPTTRSRPPLRRPAAPSVDRADRPGRHRHRPRDPLRRGCGRRVVGRRGLHRGAWARWCRLMTIWVGVLTVVRG
jgi:membrane peptidoglycan carboxypeptidase